MLVICEDCAKKYNIDETRIKRDKARFSCHECGHIIVVTKPKAVTPPAEEKKPMTDEETMAMVAAMDSPGGQSPLTASSGQQPGSSGTSLALTLVAVLVLACGAFVYYYFK